MTQTYRTNDNARWGTGQGFNLSPAQVDINFWDMAQRMLAQEARVIPSGISYFSITGNLMYVHMTDGIVLGPYELPVATFRDRGEWAPSTAYVVMDTFTINGGVYVVTFNHTSAASFDPGANDGAGHDYYSLMIQTPGSTLPTGGAVGQVLAKASTTDYDVIWGYHLPVGGTAGQTLVKQTSAPDNALWRNLDADNVDFTPVTGSSLTADNVADALEQAAGSGGGDASDITFTPATGSTITSTNVADALEEISGDISGGVHTLNDLEDVSIVSPTDGNELFFNSANSTWIKRGGQAALPITAGSTNVNPGLGHILTVTPTGALTLLCNGGGKAGEQVTVIITTSGTTSYLIDFGNSGASWHVGANINTGVTSARKWVLHFVSDSGGNLYEIGRLGPVL